MQGRVLTQKRLDEFKEHLMLEERSSATIEKYGRDADAFAAYVNGGEVTKETAIAYKNKLKDDGYAVRSINSMLASINSLFAFLGWYELRVKSIKVQQQIFCPEEKELTRAEYERLVRTAKAKHNERLCLILQTICGTGIRISELQFITLEAAQKGEATVSCKNKTRTVFIVRELQKKLIQYCKRHGIASGQIFVTKSGKRLCRVCNRTTMVRIGSNFRFVRVI